MADEEHALSRPSQTYQTPEWEAPRSKPNRFSRFMPKTTSSPQWTTADEAATKETLGPQPHHPSSTPATTPRRSFRQRFDALLPAHKTYFGRTRRVFLIIIAVLVVLFILILALGLGLGLKRNKESRYLPLPTDKSVQTGDLTYYGVGLGACGQDYNDNDPVVAVSHLVWDSVQVGGNPNTNPLCGKKIRVTRNKEGDGERSVDVMVVDRCEGCEPTDLDLSPAMFNQLADPALGRVLGTWAWLA